MPDLSPQLQSLMLNGTLSLATCWKIEREDGVTYRFTSHNRQLVVNGETYIPGGVRSSARQRQEGLAPRNIEFIGIISGEAITEEDLKAGKFSRAVVTETEVDWRYPFAGHFVRNQYIVSTISFDGEQFVAQVEGMTARLNVNVGYDYTKKCRWQRLGDANCGVNLASFTQAGEVTAVLAAKKRFTTDLTGEEDGFYDDGKIVWTTGANEGILLDVKRYLEEDGTVTLHVPSPLVIAIGDEFNIVPGCDRRVSTCMNVFNNLPNFGGFPFIPGTDDFIQTPESPE